MTTIVVWVGTVMENDAGYLTYSRVHLFGTREDGREDVALCGTYLGNGETVDELESNNGRCKMCARKNNTERVEPEN